MEPEFDGHPIKTVRPIIAVGREVTELPAQCSDSGSGNPDGGGYANESDATGVPVGGGVGVRPLAAQSDTAEITGRVVDASGAVVPAVAVVVRNDETGVKRQISTGDAGIYTVPLLHPGLYSITAQKEGFRPITRTCIELQTNQVARVDFVMEVGSVSDSVTVAAELPLLARRIPRRLVKSSTTVRSKAFR
jgi:hypothetical protein